MSDIVRTESDRELLARLDERTDSMVRTLDEMKHSVAQRITALESHVDTKNTALERRVQMVERKLYIASGVVAAGVWAIERLTK